MFNNGGTKILALALFVLVVVAIAGPIMQKNSMSSHGFGPNAGQAIDETLQMGEQGVQGIMKQIGSEASKIQPAVIKVEPTTAPTVAAPTKAPAKAQPTAVPTTKAPAKPSK